MSPTEIADDLTRRIHAEAVERKSDKYATPEEKALIEDIPDDLTEVPPEQLSSLRDMLLFVIDACQRYGYTIMPPITMSISAGDGAVDDDEEESN